MIPEPRTSPGTTTINGVGTVHYVVWQATPGGMESCITAYVDHRSGSGRDHIFSLRPGPNLLSAAVDGYTQGDRSNLRLIRSFYRYCRAHRTDRFHLMNSGPFVLLVALIAGVKDPLYHIHGTRFWNSRFDRPFLRLLWSVSSLFKVRYVANSKFCAETFRRTTVPRLPTVVYNGFDTEALLAVRRRRTRLQRMAYVGRLASGKNAHLALRIFNALADRDPGLELHIAGSGDRSNDLMDLALMSPFRKRIFFHGWVSDMPAFYSMMDLVIFPSSHESFGNVLAEALITGLPVLASDLPAFAEIHGDRDSFSLGDPSDADRFTARALEAVERFPELSSRAFGLSDRLARTFGMKAHLDQIARIHATA